MDTKSIKKHLDYNSIPLAKEAAKIVQLTLKHYSPSSFVFSSEDEQDEYLTEIDFIDNKILNNCSCPHQNILPGLCPHSIAALNVIRKKHGGIIQSRNTVLSKPVLKEKKVVEIPAANQIKLTDGVLTPEIIDKLIVKSKSNHFLATTDFQIMSVSQTEVNTRTMGWQFFAQVFKYNPDTEILEYECSCSKTKKLCEHIGGAILEIDMIFGDNLFSKNYIEENKKETLTLFGFTEEDDFDSLMTFKLKTTGFEANLKAKNISRESKDFTKIFQNSNVETSLDLPTSINKNKEFGLGLCFEFEGKKFKNIFLFQAKYNKDKTSFTSSINRIQQYNIEDALMQFTSDSEQAMIIKTMQINSGLAKFKNNKQVEYLKKAMDSKAELLATFQNNCVYTYENSKSLVCKNLEPFEFASKTVKLFFTISESAYYYTLHAKVLIDDKTYDLDSPSIQITPLFIIVEKEIVPLNDAKQSIYLDHFRQWAEINYVKKTSPEFYQKIVVPLSEKFEIQSDLFKKINVPTDEDSLEKHIYISDFDGQYIVFKPAVQYPNKLINVFSNEILIQEIASYSDTKHFLYQERNESFEDNFIEEFRRLHPAFEKQDQLFFLTPDQLMENYWMVHATDRMRQMDIKVFGANELKSFKFNTNKAVIKISLKSDIDWFDIEIDIRFGNQKLDLRELQKAFIKKTNYASLDDGSLGILPEEWMKKFSPYFKAGELRKNGIKLSNYQFGIIDELHDELEKKPAFFMDLYNKKKRLQNISSIDEIPTPKGIKAKLRDYQHHGLNWLAFLDKNQLGGCLADDMGLGKTLQTITFLQYLKQKDKKCLPSLIIAPTSLIFNWKNEIEKFCPSLKALAFVGPNRWEYKDDFSKYDLIISTYGSLLNDVEFMKDFRFNYIILDESQAIKNTNSKRYKAVRLLNSYNRLTLTGTPIENNTFDLYAQMNFINPGLLGKLSHFKTEFSDAIDKEKNHESAILLGKMISPFLLRRTKEQVAKELPEKTESIIYCEMGHEQRRVYESYKDKYRDYLLNKIDENGLEKSQMYILEGLTKLRQICNSPALISDEEDYGNQSVKLDILVENIKEKTGKHKILVFSQFVKMLQLIKTRLDEEQISYQYLDGQTSNREEKVNDFQNNADVRVFLISLKAGGTGLNLTQADYVFLVDPWWNPAVENQAIDRCYRIGQKQKVMAYRMICKDTIEEKIALLQGKKKAVASSIISVDEEKKSFDAEQVKSLFS